MIIFFTIIIKNILKNDYKIPNIYSWLKVNKLSYTIVQNRHFFILLGSYQPVIFIVLMGRMRGEPPGTQVDRHVDPGVAILAVEGQASP